LSVDPQASPKANVKGRVPISAETKDADGMFVEINIHVVDGYLDELEMWRGDLGAMKAYPDPSTYEILIQQ
jgi:hypothetical protein